MDKALGREHADRYWQLADRAQENLHQVIDRYRIDCELKSGALTAANTQGQFERLAANLPAFSARHPLRGAAMLGRTQMRECVGTDIYAGGLLMPRLPSLHPLKLTRGLATAAQEAGARLFEHSQVTGYSEDAEGVRVDCANRQV